MFRSKKWAAALAGGLVAGLALGSVSTGFAGTVTNSAPAQAVARCGAGLGGAVGAAGGRMLDVVANLTGQTPAQVATQRASGKTFAQIAADKNISTDQIVGQALKVREQVLATKVKAGSISQSQADTALSAMKSRVTQRLTDPSACDGSGPNGGAGAGSGGGAGAGSGRGSGGGQGGGARDGSCMN
jgi:hypothetical protein